MRVLAVLFLIVITSGFANAQAWIQRTNFGGDGRHRSSSFNIGNRGYIGCGHVNGNNATINYADWWEYDPASDSWSQKANYPTVNYGAIAFSASGKGYVGGGAFLNDQFYAYDPLVNTWTAIQNCPATPGDQGCFSVNNKGYVFVANAVYEYDPATGNWTTKQSAPASFPAWSVAFSIGSSGYIKYGSNFYEYKPLYDQWIPRATFPGANSGGAGALAMNNRGYIISGYVGALTNVTSEVWEYNPGNNTWLRLNDFPGSSRRFSVAFTINDRGYFGTGTNGLNFNDFWEMNDGVGINELSQRIEVKTYPQPATEYVTFSLGEYSQSQSIQVTLYSFSGAEVRSAAFTNNSCTIYKENLASGLYTFQVFDGLNIISSGKILFR